MAIQIFGSGLHGKPARRFYLIRGGPGGGKTTLANAIVGTFGEYAQRPGDELLDSFKRSSGTGLNPSMKKVVQPVRFAIFDEIANRSVAGTLVKRLSGNGEQTWRDLHEKERTDKVTATMFLICNPETTKVRVGG